VSDTVTLRPVREDDLPLLERLHLEPGESGPFQWFGWSPPGRLRRAWEATGLLDDNQGQLTVCRGQEAIGFVSWRRQQTGPVSHCWDTGITLAPGARGHGLGTQAQRLLVDYLLRTTLVNRVTAETDVANHAEQRALEKAGFTKEGVLRGHQFRDGQWRDLVLYSVLRSEWQPVDDGVAR
jgi:RimJ/RimL family protein N-acetyltransferase